jgi:4-hydroxythreonine-4-phosphate dehydrogenase
LPFFLIGDPAHLPAGTPVAEIADPRRRRWRRRGVPVLPHRFPAPATPGSPAPENAAEVIAGRGLGALHRADHKKALKDGAGFAFPGHTEYLAALAGRRRVVMMLACPALRVVPTTIHIPLAQVPAALTPDAAARHDPHHPCRADPRLRHRRAALAVAGLNPHAGEGGAMGTRGDRADRPGARRRCAPRGWR